jgi:hypothetical protein
MYKLKASGFGCLMLYACFMTSCQPSMIKGTNIPSTTPNREIYEVIQRYQRHIMAGQWNQLLSLVSPRFRESRGTPHDSTDDYGLEALRTKLQEMTKNNVKTLHFSLRIEKIEFTSPTEAKVYVYKRFSFLFPRGQYQPGFDSGSLMQLMILEKHNDRWLFNRW